MARALIQEVNSVRVRAHPPTKSLVLMRGRTGNNSTRGCVSMKRGRSAESKRLHAWPQGVRQQDPRDTGSEDDVALNAGVARYFQDPSAANYGSGVPNSSTPRPSLSVAPNIT
jgi:hypothetical protein